MNFLFSPYDESRSFERCRSCPLPSRVSCEVLSLIPRMTAPVTTVQTLGEELSCSVRASGGLDEIRRRSTAPCDPLPSIKSFFFSSMKPI